MQSFVSRKAAVLGALLVLSFTTFVSASTIIKLTVGGVSPDVAMNANHIFGTIDETGGVSPTGDQMTPVEYTSFLSFIPDITTTTASFTVANVTAIGPATPLGGGVILQNFTNGSFSLYDPGDNLLLSANLASTVLVGSTTGSVFTVNNATVTGGSLAPLLDATSLSMSFAFTDINGGAGLSIGQDTLVNPFTADTVVTIAANPVPEPTSLATITLAALALTKRRR